MNKQIIGSLAKEWLIALAVLVSLGLFQVTNAAAAEPIKIGVLTTLSGSSSEPGQYVLKAIKLYVDQHAADLGNTKVELVVRDDTGPNPDQARRLVQEMIVRNHIQFLTGTIFTPNCAAVAPLVTQTQVPDVLVVCGTSSLTTLTPYFVRASFTVWQIGYALGQWAAKSGIRTAYTAVPDYVGGYDYEAAFIKGFTAAGGTIIGSVRMPIVTPDYTPFMQRIKDAKPGAVLTFLTGGTEGGKLIKAFNDVGMKEAGIKLLGTSELTDDAELQNMGAGAIGVITAGEYSVAAERPANVAFVATWEKAYGQGSSPNHFAVGAWDGMAMIFNAIREQNGQVEAKRSMEILRHYKTDTSPRGNFFIDPETRNIVQNVYIRRVERKGNMLVNAEFDKISMVKDPWKRPTQK